MISSERGKANRRVRDSLIEPRKNRVRTISKGGQVSLPPDLRERWGVDRVLILDKGERLIIFPMPDDPVAAAKGALAHLDLPPTEELRRRAREEEAEIEERKFGYLRKT
jgi:virulence-associated protein VagC